MNTIAYSNVNDHIMTILVDHNESNYTGITEITDPLYTNYNTKNFKIIQIKSIKTNEIVDKVYQKFFEIFYTINTEYNNNTILYFLSYKKAFYYYFGFIKSSKNFEKNKQKYFNWNDGINELYQEWYDNGLIYCECHHINGNFEGSYKKYAYNKELIVDAYFVNDEPIYYNQYNNTV
jgi:hypothetical protein